MKKFWFKKIGWFYLPVKWPGWVVAIFFAIFCVHIFIFVDSKSHSVSDTFYGIFPFIVPAFLFYIWVASENSEK
jgi:hypothetical protein